MISAQDVREMLGRIEALAGIADIVGETEDLFERGLDSFGSVQLMLALEERCDIEFPDHLLNRRSFSTIRAIRATVAALSEEPVA